MMTMIPDGKIYIEWRNGRRDEIARIEVSTMLTEQGNLVAEMSVRTIGRLRAAWLALGALYRIMRGFAGKGERDGRSGRELDG